MKDREIVEYGFDDGFDDTKVVEEPGASYNSQKDFTTLEAWKQCREVRMFFYEQVIPCLPNVEKYDLGSQTRRAAVSTTLNIAEGYGRYSYKEGVRFYVISRGSIYELKDILITCKDLDYIDQEIYDHGIALLEKAKVILNGFIKFCKTKIQ